MTTPVSKRPSPAEISARLEETRRTNELLRWRCEELSRISAHARMRRSEIRRQRTQLRADLVLRRADRRAEGRAAAAILEAAATVSGTSVEQLWLDCVALGGDFTVPELRAMLAGTRPLTRWDYDHIALAINERLQESGRHRLVAYWDGSR